MRRYAYHCMRQKCCTSSTTGGQRMKGLETRDVTIAEKIDPTCLVLLRYWVREEEVNAQLKGKWNSRLGVGMEAY